jgi:hypothetical protein
VEEFRSEVMTTGGFADIVHYWGVFHGGHLAGWAQNYVFGDREVRGVNMKFDPEHLPARTAYALNHTINDFYLGQHSFAYVNQGVRNLLHETNYQDFLVEHFGFEKALLDLHLVYRRPFGTIVRAASPFSRVLNRATPRLGALCRMDAIARSQR